MICLCWHGKPSAGTINPGQNHSKEPCRTVQESAGHAGKYKKESALCSGTKFITICY